MFEKLVVVTRKTRLTELIERFNTRGQARFYIEHAGGDFAAYEREDDDQRRALDALDASLRALKVKVQVIDRSFVPTFLFTEHDLIVTAGQDGLVANTAKYVGAQPIVAVNPDPARIDGVLLPFTVQSASEAVRKVLVGRARYREVTLAEASLSDGQRLLAFNDLFVGARTHVSSRYRICVGDGREEVQSSSGVIVSTGAGSTGWLSSVFNMVDGIAASLTGAQGVARPAFTWEDPRLFFVVREPFVSRQSSAKVVTGAVAPGDELVIESLMPAGGAIFSDGIEEDFVAFNSGATARIRAASQRAKLVVG
jgi:NAD kinase